MSEAYTETQKKQILIQDAMIGAHYLLPHEEVFVYPFTDFLALLYQTPLIFNFWDQSKDEQPVFSSLSDPEFISERQFCWSKDHMYMLSDRIGLTIHDFSHTDCKPAIEKPATVDANGHSVKELFDGLFPNRQDKTVRAVLEMLERSLLVRADRNKQLDSPMPTLELDDEVDVQQKLNPMVTALEEMLKDQLNSRTMTIRSPAGFKLPNLFPVFRSVCSGSQRHQHFKYRAGLRLFHSSAELIRDWFRKNQSQLPSNLAHLADPVQTLESPTGPNSRSIADMVFSSGLVDFGRKPSEDSWDVAADASDRMRQQVEQFIYPKDNQLFYVPIHAGGSPWMCLFTFSPPSGRGWFHNYVFYRDVIQSIAPQIRGKAEEVYIDLVGEAVVSVFRALVNTRHELRDKINTRLQRLAQVYPFPIIQVAYEDGPVTQPCSVSNDEFFVPGRGTFKIEILPNCFFNRQVQWCLGNERRIGEMLRKAVRDFTSLEKDIELSIVAKTSHLFQTPLHRMGDRIKVASIGLGEKATQDLKREVDTLRHLTEFASALMGTDKKEKVDDLYRKPVQAKELAHNIQSHVAWSISPQCDPRLDSDEHRRIRSLQSNGSLDVKLVGSFGNEMVIAYEPLTMAIIDGFLSNAFRYLDADSPQLSISLSREDHSFVFNVRNNTDGNLE